jgi:hypothetical protein
MSFVLVLYIYAGMLAKGDSVAMQVIDGFTSKESCDVAGMHANELVKNSTKEYRFTCLIKR